MVARADCRKAAIHVDLFRAQDRTALSRALCLPLIAGQHLVSWH
jgi:hypothetical protein